MFAVFGSLLKVWVIPGLTGGPSLEQQTNVRKQPAPLNCDVAQQEESVLRNSLNGRFCEWNSTLHACREMLMAYVYKEPSWVLLGDNGMAKVADFISQKWPFDSYNATSYRNSCRNMAYYGLPPPTQGWSEPNAALGEGPLAIGRSSPYCTDCTKCWNVLMEGPKSAEKQYVEYLVIEYSRDVALPTQVTTTTQETAAHYLEAKSPGVCIASTGLNDAAIDPPISDDLYLKNSDDYLRLLQQACKSVIWIGIPAIVEKTTVPQSNCRLKRWNVKMFELIQKRNYTNVFAIDIWNKTMKTGHVGSLALEGKFYFTLARLFVSLMAGPEVSRV